MCYDILKHLLYDALIHLRRSQAKTELATHGAKAYFTRG